MRGCPNECQFKRYNPSGYTAYVPQHSACPEEMPQGVSISKKDNSHEHTAHVPLHSVLPEEMPQGVSI